jgi:hypothetical protein
MWALVESLVRSTRKRDQHPAALVLYYAPYDRRAPRLLSDWFAETDALARELPPGQLTCRAVDCTAAPAPASVKALPSVEAAGGPPEFDGSAWHGPGLDLGAVRAAVGSALREQ